MKMKIKNKKGLTRDVIMLILIAVIFLVIAAIIIAMAKGWGTDLIAHLRSLLRVV